MKWQPIETAPKDGSWLLLYGDPYSNDWAVFVGRFEKSGWQQPDGFDLEPTHWMPLPLPPSDAHNARLDGTQAEHLTTDGADPPCK